MRSGGGLTSGSFDFENVRQVEQSERSSEEKDVLKFLIFQPLAQRRASTSVSHGG